MILCNEDKCARVHKVICNVCRMGISMYRETYSVMLVDDEAYTRKLVGERISKIPGVTLAASLPNGFGAKRYLLEHVVDIVVTDIKMPLLDGLELAEFISEFVPSCPIIIISGYGEFEYARKAIQFGVKDYLLKPIQFKQIVEIIEKSCRTVQQRREQVLSLQNNGKDTQEQCIFAALSEKDTKKHGNYYPLWKEQSCPEPFFSWKRRSGKKTAFGYTEISLRTLFRGKQCFDSMRLPENTII